MPAALGRLAVGSGLGVRVAGPPSAPGALRPAPAMRRLTIAAAGPAAAAQRQGAAAAERPPPSPSSSSSSSALVGSYPVPTSWLAYSWRVSNLLETELQLDAELERLRRQLGWGGRWAWQDEEEEAAEAAPAEPEADDEEAEEDEEEAACSSSSSSPQPLAVASSRCAGRRSRARRRCRGQPQAGAVPRRQAQRWSSAADPLSDEPQVGSVRRCIRGGDAVRAHKLCNAIADPAPVVCSAECRSGHPVGSS